MMNELSWPDIQKELFDEDENFQKASLSYLLCIQKRLGISGQLCIFLPDRARMAASMITRAEAELFGVSIPRYAIRVYADQDHTSFFNLRRSARLSKAIRSLGGWSDRKATKDLQIKEAVVLNTELPDTQKAALIADSVLIIPDSVRQKYYVLSANIHGAYGELVKTDVVAYKYECTPFVQHCWTVGLCGHGAVFIAATLLRSHIKSIHALSEIAALLRDPKKAEILITGLSPRHIARYFSKDEVGLRAEYQSVPAPYVITENIGMSKVAHPDQLRDETFACGLRSYLLSGFPILKHTDYGRMHGCGQGWHANVNAIYRRPENSGMSMNLATCSSTARDHFVVVLGCGKSSVLDFIIHDPGGLPYLEASSVELMKASSYKKDHGPNTTAPLLSELCFQPVVPSAIQMPLHQQVSGASDNDRKIGLYDIALHYFVDMPEIFDGTNFKYPQASEFLRGDFRLVQAGKLINALKDQNWMCSINGQSLPARILHQLTALQSRLLVDRNHWLWVQRFNESCWIWDAELPPPVDCAYEMADLYKYLICVASSELASPVFFNHIASKPPKPELPAEEPVFQRKSIPISLITSFCTKGIETSLTSTKWPLEVKLAEVYTFLQEDVKKLLPKYIPAVSSAVEAMSLLWDKPIEIDSVATVLLKMFDNVGVKIRALCTFIPELLHDEGSSSRENGIKALIFLARLADRIRLGGHINCDVIEIVGGSVMSGVLPVQFGGSRCILGNRRNSNELAPHLLNALARVHAQLPDTSKIRIAIEAEPGPLFAFGTEEGIDALVSAIELGEKSLELPIGFVGLNVDIGHWMISGIPPKKLSDPKIAKRIFGAHISDHDRGHFGDSFLGTSHAIKEFEEWVREMRKISDCQLSGISIEFETIKDKESLAEAVRLVGSVPGLRFGL